MGRDKARLEWNGVPLEKPLARVRDTVAILRQALAGEKTDYDGETLRSHGFRCGALPGKPLRMIAGEPMIQHVHRVATETQASEVWIATDDERIEEAARGFGANVCMTSADHRSGTDRLAEVCEKNGWPDDLVVVNLQGDEPLVPPIVALLERSHVCVPSELRALAATVERDAATAIDRTAQAVGDAVDDEEDERKQMQIANRERQLQMQQKRKNKERRGR